MRALLFLFFCLVLFNSPAFSQENPLSSPVDKPNETLEEKVARLESKIERLETLLTKMESHIKGSIYTRLSKNMNEMEDSIAAVQTDIKSVDDIIAKKLDNKTRTLSSSIIKRVEGNISKEVQKQLDSNSQELSSTMQARIEKNVKKQIEEKLQQTITEQVTRELAILEPAAGENQTIVTLSPELKIMSSDGRFAFQPFGRINADVAIFNDDKVDQPDGASIRRARLGFKGKIDSDWEYKTEVDFANESLNLRDIYIAYVGYDNTTIRAGQFKPPFGLEELTSSSSTTFIERASPITSFATKWQIGAGASTYGEGYSLAAGIFNDDTGTTSSDDEAWQVSARVTATPILKGNKKLLHVGAAASYRSPDSTTELVRYNSKAENTIQSAFSVDTGASGITDAENQALLGLETAAVIGSTSLQAEYIHSNVDRANGSDLDFNGWYIQGSHFLTGESRPYNPETGTFGRISPKHPFNPKQGTWGAVEIAGRYSSLDLTDQDITGGEMDNFTAAINWYLNSHIRLMANYIKVDTDNNAVTADDDPDILLMRAQVDF